MTAPFIVIRTFTIKEGKLEGFKQFLRELFKFIETNEPHLLAINASVNEDGTEVTFIQVHPVLTGQGRRGGMTAPAGIRRKIRPTPVGDAYHIGPRLCRMWTSENTSSAQPGDFHECTRTPIFRPLLPKSPSV